MGLRPEFKLNFIQNLQVGDFFGLPKQKRPAIIVNSVICDDDTTHRHHFSLQKGLLFMIKVKARVGESVQQMVKRFKKMCEKEGLVRDMKRMSYYEKPSVRKRRRIRKTQRIT